MYKIQNQAKQIILQNIQQQRTLSKYLDKDIHAKAVRQKFLDYFIKDNGYNFVKSSPVVPFYDPSVPFVNAGMNQFKGIFLGTNSPKYNKVANTQKCIRVGGKHNDLDIIGTDGYHHTFFEMLGNWSFGDCSKEESCKLAWNLLTDVYKINKNVLYVTYFGGDKALNLEPDLECRDVWKSLGVAENRILPFGMKDNFWEMGLSGPCGPCTEIHFDHLGPQNRANFVNKDLHDLVELWNIVFIEYNRDSDGQIKPLPQKHVDTGMGFERLVAVLQKKISNYDTDLFTPLFEAIQKNCPKVPKYRNVFGENDWSHLHTSYRILADHTRMLTVSLADGMIPEQNQKLRKIMRRAFAICETNFDKRTHLVKELSNYVIEHLGPVYPELEKNAAQIHQIINYEEELFKSLRVIATNEWSKITSKTPALEKLDILEMPGLIQAYKEINSHNLNEITSQFAYKLFDTFGLDKDTISKLSDALQIKFDVRGFEDEVKLVKARSKEGGSIVFNSNPIDLQNLGPLTDDLYVYEYDKVNDAYVFNDLNVKVLKIIVGGADYVDAIKPRVECTLLLDKSNMFCESGGQCSDLGGIKFDEGEFQVYHVAKFDNRVLHKGVYKSTQPLHVQAEGVMRFDHNLRLNHMRNHTAVHLLNATLRELKGAVCQKSSKVTDKYFNLDVGVFGSKLDFDDLLLLELRIGQIIKDGVDVRVSEVDSQFMLGLNDVTMIPGEVYPENGIRLVEIIGKNNFLSREPCCGTHVLNTADLEDFCIVNFKSLGRSTSSIYGVTGNRARLARANGLELQEDIANLQKILDDNIDKLDVLDMAVALLKERLNYNVDYENLLPIIVKQDCLDKLNFLSKTIKESAKETLKEFIEMEMQSVIQTKKLKSESNKDYIVHYLRTSMILESVSLTKATKLCQNVPVLVISYSDNIVKARCCVPSNQKTDQFNAETWLNVIGRIFNSQVVPPKGQDASIVCNMKGKKVSMSEWHTLLNDSLQAAKIFASKHL